MNNILFPTFAKELDNLVATKSNFWTENLYKLDDGSVLTMQIRLLPEEFSNQQTYEVMTAILNPANSLIDTSTVTITNVTIWNTVDEEGKTHYWLGRISDQNEAAMFGLEG